MVRAGRSYPRDISLLSLREFPEVGNGLVAESEISPFTPGAKMFFLFSKSSAEHGQHLSISPMNLQFCTYIIREYAQ